LLIRDGQSHSTDIHEDNLHGDFSLNVSPIRDSSGTVLGSVHILRDITEHKKVEEALKESEKKFREIFNSANDAIHLHEIDERGLPGKMVDVNTVACQMVQYTKEELLEMSPLDLTTEFHSRPVQQIGEEIKTKGSSLFETRYRRKDGSVVPVEVNAHVVVIQGRKLVLSIVRNLTRRKRDEAALHRLSADHKAIIDNAPAMIFYKDTKNNFIRVNPAGARAFGMPVDQIEGRSCFALFPDFAEKYYQDDLEVINSGKPKLSIVEPMTVASGEQICVQTDKIPLMDEHGIVTGVLLFAVDMTERKKAEEALALASKKLNLLSSITRHDIRNQLTALNAYISLSGDVVNNPAELRDFFVKEQKIADTITSQIDFTKDYEDLGVESAIWQDVSALVRDAVTALPMRNVGLEIACSGLEIFADPLLNKVFYNLIDNALRYGGDTMTAIWITAEERENDLRIIFEDNGVGITADDKKQLFTKGFGKHTGLGLFLSREILSITGITITENGEPGKGARFEITVPKDAYRL
jgi:PAS domain S-box-containing protein